MTTAVTTKRVRWKWIRHQGQVLSEIGTNEDGSLYNPRGYDPDLVWEAMAEANARRRARASAAAKKAARTRARRKEQLIYEAAKRIIDGHVFGPRKSCFICGRGLGDPESIERGIGSDCWQFVLEHIKVTPTTQLAN